MSDIIDKFSLNLTDAEKAGLNKIVESGEQSDIQSSIESITERFAKINMSDKIRKQYDKSSSEDFNQQFFDFYNDLMTLYLASSKLDSVIETEDSESMSTLKNLKKKLKKIEKEIRIKKIIAMDDTGFVDAFEESFETRKSYEDYNRYLYVDPEYNRYFNEDEICNYNSTNKCIKSAIEESFENFNISVEKNDQSGESFIEYANKDEDIENILHGNIYDKWSEVIISPSKINIDYDNHLYKNLEDNTYINNGAMCNLKFELNTPTPINTISLKPFSKYPFEIVKILAFPSRELYKMFKKEDDYSIAKKMGQINEILGPESFNQIKGPIVLDEPQIISFSDVDEVSVIEISLRQQNYSTSRYNLSREEKDGIDTIKTITENKDKESFVSNNKDIDSVVELDYFNRRLNWLPFKDLINNITDLFNDKDNIIDNMIYGLEKYFNNFKSDKLKKYLDRKEMYENNSEALTKTKVDVNKFEYQYGFYNIDIKYNHYKQDSIYISDLKKMDTNIKEVGLNVEDSITDIKDLEEKDYVIDYYVTNLENPNRDDWYPILPESYREFSEDTDGIRIKEIFKPTINTSGELYTELKFHGDPTLDLVVKNNEGDILDSSYTNDNREIIINEFENNNNFKEFNGRFEVYYYIDQSKDNPFIVDFDDIAEPIKYSDKNGISGEVFINGTDKNQQIKLSYYPYIEYEKINNTIVDPNNFDIDDQIIKEYNPNNYEYNPNYSVQKDGNQKGYRPIIIEMDGQALEYDTNDSTVDIKEDNFHNDTLGIPFNFSYIAEEDNTYIPKEINRSEINKVEGKIKPYFYNKTDYISGEIPGLLEYDPKENPVFEYNQMGKTINFNDSFNTNGSSNMGKIRVHYSYLVEGIRVMAIMRKLKKDNDTTPVVYDYIIKTKNFR